MGRQGVNNLVIFFLAFAYTLQVLIAANWQECLLWLVLAVLQLSVIAKVRWHYLGYFVLFLIIPSISLFVTSYLHLKESVKGMETAIWGIRVDSYRFDTSLYLTIRAAVLSLISFSYLTAIRYDRLIYSLIRNLRFPVELGYALLASFNAVGKMKDEYKRIRQAAVMRFSRKPLYYFYLIPLLVSATRYSQQAAMSMQTRGLNKKKSFIIDEKIRLYDVLIFISNLAGMLLVRLKIN